MVVGLVGRGLINDATFADQCARRFQREGKARWAVLSELTRRGVPRALAEETVHKHYPEDETEVGSARTHTRAHDA